MLQKHCNLLKITREPEQCCNQRAIISIFIHVIAKYPQISFHCFYLSNRRQSYRNRLHIHRKLSDYLYLSFCFTGTFFQALSAQNYHIDIRSTTAKNYSQTAVSLEYPVIKVVSVSKDVVINQRYSGPK